ncbi:hypothetical protein NKR23_g6651 [Pleurostoma richardsiae]|uniref:Uncharacterized protein n=1 Tax=Pleurostoma richardsiae TaxID=41990 RepID=A0AA38RAL3_9PEZI|nr:hypothetical protein NKR23_g6651 [Pleurostoma richardsiae]
MQHMILNTAQRVLEQCFFDFASRTMPSILMKRNWDCAASVELTKWTRLFSTKKGRVNLQVVRPQIDNDDLSELLVIVSKLRRTAVHRLPVTARGVSQFLDSAVKLANLLGETSRAGQLEELWSDVNSKVNAMELNKNVLEDTVTRELQDIQQKREELDRLEAELTQGMLKDDLDNKTLIGQLLEDSLQGIFSKGKKKEEVGDKEKDDDDEDNDEEGEEEEDEEDDNEGEGEEEYG